MRRVGLLTRWPRWTATLVVAGVIVAGGAAAIGKWPHAWWWLVVIVVAAAAMAPPALAALSQASRRRLETGRVTRTELQGTTGPDGRTLPLAGSAELESRVHRTALRIPYIQRDEEETIRAHLRARRPVLLIGSSMVGKTKMAARVIAEEFSSWPVAIPDGKTALANLDANDLQLRGAVIWLDDIDRLIGADGITDGAMRRLAAADNVIVGTIRARAYDQLQPSDQMRLPEWDVLGVFEPVFVKRDLSQAEQERLADAVDDPEVLDRIRVVGLGEYAGAARQVAEALKLGAADTNPLGYALVLAAADWRRCGMTRPVPDAVIARLALPHLGDRGHALFGDDDTVRSGLAWATRDINPNVALLHSAGTEAYVVYDYALDLISAQGAPIPDVSWAAVIANADPAELLIVGHTAVNTFDRYDIAAQAYRDAASSTHPQAAPIGSAAYGQWLADQGDVDGAKEAYQKAIDSGHAQAAALANLGYGQVLEALGDVTAAKERYRKAVDSGDLIAAPVAGFGYAQLLAAEGDTAGAKAAFQRVIASGNLMMGPHASFGYGSLLFAEGDVVGAKAAYQQALDSENLQAAALASANYGALLATEGDEAGAAAAYQEAIDSGYTPAAAVARVGYGSLLAEQGDVEGAKEAYQQAIDSGYVHAAPTASLMYGQLLAAEGDFDGAKEAYQQALDSGHAQVVPLARLGYAQLLEGQSDVAARDADQA